jgi:hypothetical protein
MKCNVCGGFQRLVRAFRLSAGNRNCPYMVKFDYCLARHRRGHGQHAFCSPCRLLHPPLCKSGKIPWRLTFRLPPLLDSTVLAYFLIDLVLKLMNVHRPIYRPRQTNHPCSQQQSTTCSLQGQDDCPKGSYKSFSSAFNTLP